MSKRIMKVILSILVNFVKKKPDKISKKSGVKIDMGALMLDGGADRL